MSSHHVPRPAPEDIFRYRYQHGTNLGGIFVLEQWLNGSMFDNGVAGGSELDAVVSSVNIRGVDKTRAKWEEHWSSALSDGDLDWLTNTARCTMIRLPIGYFTLGPAFCANTPFAMQPAQVYVNAWASVKTLVARCYSCGIGVLLDLHAVPGGANSEIHSGTSSGNADLWGNQFNLDLATKCLTYIAEEVGRGGELEGVIGIQLCNEAQWAPPAMYDWYNSVIERISRINNAIPLYISDGWDLRRALEWARGKNRVSGAPSNPIFVDTHKYYAFSERHKRRGPRELIAQVATELDELHEYTGNVFDHQGASAIFVGEYSCALAPQTWKKVRKGEQSELAKQFGKAQSKRWQEKACGSAFWTLKMDWMPGGDWGFMAQVASGAVLAQPCFSLSVAEVTERLKDTDANRSRLMTQAIQAHHDYWNNASPGEYFEHWRYADGWHLGWTDARDFFRARLDGLLPCTVVKGGRGKTVKAVAERDENEHEQDQEQDGNRQIGADKIGALDLWVLKRMKVEKMAEREVCPFGWEWEHGFRTGVEDFYRAVKL